MTPEQIQEIKRLRALNLSPKQIARKLGLRPAEVSHLLQGETEAETLRPPREQSGLAPLKHCLINENAARKLLEPKRKGWFGLRLGGRGENDAADGLAQIFVARVRGDKYLVCSYLVDYWCLGVKNALGPRKLNRSEYEAMVKKSYASFGQGHREISLEQAQAIILGVVEYASQLGLKPHRDFAATRGHLGEPSENLPPVEFGREGKPFYVNGPDDNPKRIIAKLRETVGEGNFDYMILG